MNLTIRRNDLKSQHKNLPMKKITFEHFNAVTQQMIRNNAGQAIFRDDNTEAKMILAPENSNASS